MVPNAAGQPTAQALYMLLILSNLMSMHQEWKHCAQVEGQFSPWTRLLGEFIEVIRTILSKLLSESSQHSVSVETHESLHIDHGDLLREGCPGADGCHQAAALFRLKTFRHLLPQPALVLPQPALVSRGS